MITEHVSFLPPVDPNISIWRYMDLTKFLWMLQKSALYFARADLLGDPFEGHHTKKTIELEEAWIESLRKRQGGSLDMNLAVQNVRAMFRNASALKSTHYVNCWHMNDSESAAMWKLYTSHHQSVCVQSNYKLLATLLPDSCFAGCVKYIDYETDEIPHGNILNNINYKRRSFEHERELRAVFWKTDALNYNDPLKLLKDDLPRGKCVPIAINDLIESVYVNPSSDDVLFDVVSGICEQYRLQAPVLKSGVNAPPAY